MDNTTISFTGQGASQILADHSDAVEAICKLCTEIGEANILIHVSPRNERMCLEWPIQVRSSKGQRTVLMRQMRPAGPATFVNY